MMDIDWLKQEDVQRFIEEHTNEDVGKLVLNPPKQYKDQIKILAEQIASRQKAVGKLDDWVRRQDLIFPPPLSIEQASSLVTAGYKKTLIQGELLVDLTGGTGIDTLALSDGFDQTIYVEQNLTLCQLFAHNSAALGKKVRVKNQSAEEFLRAFQGKATFFIDPARRSQANKKVFKLEDCTPDVKELLPAFQSCAVQVLIKLSPLLDLTSTLKALPHVKEVHVVSVKNDCKELLLLIDFSFSEEPSIHAINLETEQQPLVFKQSEERLLAPDVQGEERYLYEPNASILKAGAFKTVAMAYEVKKVAPNTHLYSAARAMPEFPGKGFEIIEPKAKEKLKDYGGTINVITRNYPMSTAALKQKYRLKDGGSDYLIGYRDANNRSHLVIARRLP